MRPAPTDFTGEYLGSCLERFGLRTLGIGLFGDWALWGLGTLGVGDIVSYLRIPVKETPPEDEANLG